MGEPRPIPEDPTQAEQAAALTETGNGPTVDQEEQLLREQFGEPDGRGVYGATEQEDGGAGA